jgi:single-strand DNA-binding protein
MINEKVKEIFDRYQRIEDKKIKKGSKKMSFNKAILMGRLTRDVELKEVNDTHVGSFGVAVDSGWGDNKKTTFIDIVTWGKQAEFVSKYFFKGDGIHIEGRIDLDTWEKDGEKRSKHKVTAEKVTFPLGKSGGADGGVQKAKEAFNGEEIPF